MGTDKATFAEVERGGATGSDVTGSGPDRTRKWSRDPEGIPLGARMRNRKLRNIRPSRAFSPVVTSVTWPRRGFPWVRPSPTGSWGFPPFFRVFSDMLCSTLRPRSLFLFSFLFIFAGRKVSWIVIRYGQYGRKASWIVKRYGKYGRKVSWIVKWYGK